MHETLSSYHIFTDVIIMRIFHKEHKLRSFWSSNGRFRVVGMCHLKTDKTSVAKEKFESNKKIE